MRLLLTLFWFAALAAPAQTPAPAADPLAPHRRALARATTDSARGRLLWALSEYTDSEDSIAVFAQFAVPPLERALSAARGAERRCLLGLLGATVNNIGVGINGSGRNIQAAPYYLKAAALRGQAKDVRGQVESLWNVANLHSNLGE